MLPEVVMFTLKVIRWRNFIRRVFNTKLRAETKEQGYLDQYPWLVPLIPIGSSAVFWESGIKFEKFTDELMLKTGSGSFYLVDEFGQALAASHEGFDLFRTVGDNIERAIRKLPVNIAYVRYVVRVYRDRAWIVRIHRVDKAVNLADLVHEMMIRGLRARAELGRQAVLQNEQLLNQAREAARLADQAG